MDIFRKSVDGLLFDIWFLHELIKCYISVKKNYVYNIKYKSNRKSNRVPFASMENWYCCNIQNYYCRPRFREKQPLSRAVLSVSVLWKTYRFIARKSDENRQILQIKYFINMEWQLRSVDYSKWYVIFLICVFEDVKWNCVTWSCFIFSI